MNTEYQTPKAEHIAIAAEDVIPHRSPMRMIDSLEEWSDDCATAFVVFDENHMATRDGLVVEPALVECVAQTVAAMEGVRNTDSAKPVDPAAERMSMLCGVSDFTIHHRPTAGKRLEVTVQTQKRLGKMLLAEGRILCEGQIMASGLLKLVE